MDLGLGFSLSDIPWSTVIAAVVGLIGMGLAALALGSANGTKIMRVPDGEEPDQYYRRWKAASLSKKLSRGGWFLLCLSIGMGLGGCGVVVIQVIR